MFTWICPKCGREVPPSYTECPECAKAAEATAPPAPTAEAPPAQAPPPPVRHEPAPVYAAPAQPRQQVYYAPPVPRGGLPTWVMALLFAGLFAAAGAGIYYLVGSKTPATGGGPSAAVESPGAKAGKTHPYQKYIEISGVRFVENARKKPEVKFVITNHSAAELDGLAGNVTLWARTQKSEEDEAGTFRFNTRLGPWESKDLTAPLETKHKIYELPDWQNLSPDIQITAPAMSGIR